jgi:hypothetical protein
MTPSRSAMRPSNRDRSVSDRSGPPLTERQELNSLAITLSLRRRVEEALAAIHDSAGGQCDFSQVQRLRREVWDMRDELRRSLPATLHAVDQKILRAALRETEAIWNRLDEALFRAGVGGAVPVSDLPPAVTVRGWRLVCATAERRLRRPGVLRSHRTSTLGRVRPRRGLRARPHARRRREGGRQRAARAGPDDSSGDPEPAGRREVRHDGARGARSLALGRPRPRRTS